MVVRVNKKQTSTLSLLASLTCFLSVSAQATSTNDLPPSKSERFEQALKARTEGKTYQAIELLEELVEQNPSHARLQLELAKSYYQAHQYQLAEATVEDVLQDTSSSETARNKSQQFLNRINEKKVKFDSQRHSFKGSIKMFTGNDTNANAAPADNDLEEGILPISSISQEDTFIGASISLKHRYQFSGSYNIADKPATLSWLNSLKVSDKNYDDIDRSDLTVTTINTGLTLSQKRNWNTGIKLRGEHIRLGGENLAYYTSIIPSYTHFFDKASVSLTPRYTRRDYVDSNDKGKEGHRSSITLAYTHPFDYDITLRLAVDAATTDLEDDWRSYDTSKFSLRVLKKFTPELSLSFSSSYEDKQYDSFAPSYSEDRHDKTTRAGLGLKYKLTPAIVLGLKYSYTDRDSNQEIRVYDRERLEASIGYNF
ncbi:hypothetical protein R50073_35090 [Maricurvus nonylphenolicus]|uniref:outer membrane beta-barrel protein n=1 Tax=Maricurvus nonylphenolicus TaxID=1008307 RepID=UPI0036F2B894